MTGLPNLTGDPEGAETVEQWFNPAAFTPVPSGTFGNARRNILRGPGWVTFDMSVQRPHRLQRARQRDAALATSSTSSTAPTSGCRTRTSSAPTAGVISTLAGDPRGDAVVVAASGSDRNR